MRKADHADHAAAAPTAMPDAAKPHLPQQSFVHLPPAAREHMSEAAHGALPHHIEGDVPAFASFDGATVNYAFEVATHYRALLASQDLTIGPDVEMTNFPGYAPYVGTLDIGGNELTVHFSSAASFGAATFDGFILQDFYNQVPDLTGVTLLNNGGSSALTQSDISFDANHVSVNLAGTSFAAGSDIVLGFQFASAGEAQAPDAIGAIHELFVNAVAHDIPLPDWSFLSKSDTGYGEVNPGQAISDFVHSLHDIAGWHIWQ